MDMLEHAAGLTPTFLWWLFALLGPCLLALIPTGNAQKGGRP
jgi:hypothetical protein